MHVNGSECCSFLSVKALVYDMVSIPLHKCYATFVVRLLVSYKDGQHLQTITSAVYYYVHYYVQRAHSPHCLLEY